MKNKKYEIDDIDNMIQFIREHANEYFCKIKQNPEITAPIKVIEFIEATIFSLNKENFGVIYLNTKNKIIDYEIISEGIIDQSIVDTRKLIKNIIDNNAKSIIVFHNHPSGDTKPSNSDIILTKKIKQICNTINAQLLDHIITGEPGKYYSFADNRGI